eukprot:6223063-Ditylum_brightwellii.AAC.2
MRSALFSQGTGKKKGRDKAISLGSFEIAGGCNNQYCKMKDALTSMSHAQDIQFKKAVFPIFANSSPLIYITCAVALGCDVFPGGVKNLGVMTVGEKIVEPEQEENDIRIICKQLIDFV